MSETLNEERSFGSKQAYLSIILPEIFQLRDGNAGTWTIEDEGKNDKTIICCYKNNLFIDGCKICDGEFTGSMHDQTLLDYIPRDKQVAHLKYELVVCEDEKCTMMNGDVQPVNQTDSIIEFVIKIEQSIN